MHRITTLVLGAVTGLTGVPATPEMPNAFGRVPAQVRARATVVVTATFTEVRVPWRILRDGSEAWAMLGCFEIGIVYRGKVRARHIMLQEGAAVGPNGQPIRLVKGGTYLLLLRPSNKSRRQLGDRLWTPHPEGDYIPKQEVLAVLEQ